MSKNFSKRRLVCCRCQEAQPALKRSKTGEPICKPCFFEVFELDVHETITKYGLFNRGEKVAIAASGGKDSTVLAHVLQVLNERFDYGLQLCLLAVDEGISGYRDDSLDSLRKYQERSGLALNIVSYGELYGGWTMDRVVRAVGRSNNCTFCGVFRRQALDRGAALIGANKLVTGHNADDLAETVVMNILRGDLARLARCTDVVTSTDGMIPRCKPLKYAFQKEIVHYAYLQRLEYFATECSYAPQAYRLNVRNYVKSLERCAPLSILDILDSAEKMRVREGVRMPRLARCERCTYVSSQSICKACVLLDGLNAGLPQFGIGRAPKMRRMLRERQQAAEADGQQSPSTFQSACKSACACRATQSSSDIVSNAVSDCQSAKCNRNTASSESNVIVKDRPEQHDDDIDADADSSCGGTFGRLLAGRAAQEQITSNAASEELSDFLSAIDL